MRPLLLRLLVAAGTFIPGLIRADPDPVTLANARIEVGIDPAHGLILGFHLPGQPNLLWRNPHPLTVRSTAGWINYGGDKLWWGPQIDWLAVTGRRFPPDEALDGAWQVTEQRSDHLVMRSAVSPWVGIRAEREITLDPGQAGVVIRNRFIRESAGHQRLQLWTVCQLPRPQWCWLESRPAPGEKPFVNLRPTLDPGPAVQPEPALGVVRGSPSPARPYLIGTRGAWLAAIYDSYIVVHEVGPFPDGNYAEQVSLQLFFGPENIELETLGGLATPALGESMTNVVRWRVLGRPAGLGEADLARWLRGQIAPR
jgi:hypothetical protein